MLFAANYQPCLGKVIEVKTHSPKPIVVQVYRQVRASKDYVSAKFKDADAVSDKDPEQHVLKLPQIKGMDLMMTDTTCLNTTSRLRVKKILG